MTPLEAEEIINKFWKSIKSLGGATEIVQPISDLPCSQGKIKYAHFIYGEELIKKNLLTDKVGSQLIESYAKISQVFVEDPETINAEHRQYIDSLKRGVHLNKNPRLHLAGIGLKDNIEYNNFLADCQGNYRKDKEKLSPPEDTLSIPKDLLNENVK